MVDLRGRPQSLGSAFVYGSALLFTFVVWAATAGVSTSLAQYLSVAIVLLCALRVSNLCLARTAGPVGLCFYLFVMVWIGIASLVQLQTGKLPWPDTVRTDLFSPAQLLTLTAIIAHSAGYELSGRLKLSKPDRTESAAIPAWRPQPSTSRVMFCILFVAVPSVPFTGGLSGRFASRQEYNDQLSSAGFDYAQGQSVQLGFLKILPSSIALAGVVVAILAITYRRVRWRDTPVILAAALALAVAAVVVFANPVSSTRFIAFSVLLAAALTIYQLSTPIRKGIFALFLLIGLIAGYPLAAWFKEPTASDRLPTLGAESFTSVDFDGFQQVVNSIVYVERIGHSAGSFTISGLFYWVPRSIWSDKELPASYAVSAARNYPAENLALPLWSELYIDFSLVGMVILMVAIGLASRRLDRAYVSDEVGVLRTTALIVAGAEIGLLRGPIGAQIPFAATAIVLGLLAHLSLRTTSHRVRLSLSSRASSEADLSRRGISR